MWPVRQSKAITCSSTPGSKRHPGDALYCRGVVGNGDGTFDGSALPAVTGTDFADEVVAVGDDVQKFGPGDHVLGTGLADSPHATAAGDAVVPADHSAQLPTRLIFLTKIETYLTTVILTKS
jgi:NADPH:quinone reductase-like Zn-dependent oxidoreductase